MIKKKTFPFLESIVNFDLRKYYTPKIRFLAHATMWIVFTGLLFVNYFLGYHLEAKAAFLMALRMSIANFVVFYLFFYLVVPYTFNRNYFFLFLVSIPCLLFLWLLVNHYFYVILYETKVKIDDGILDSLIEKNHKTPTWEVISFKNFFARLFEVLMAVAPFLFMKLFFDTTRLYSKLMKHTKKIESLNIQNLTMENKFLLTQLNPHFLFNTLNNIYGLSIKKDDLAPDFILKLSEIMRYTLYYADSDFIPLSKEIEFTKNYFEMERMRYSKNYNIELMIKTDKKNDPKIAPLLFFAFVENAFKYGLKSDHPFLKVIIENSENNLYFAVINDKTQPERKNFDGIGGIGLENVKRRLELIYPKRHELEIVNGDELFKVELRILL